MCICNWGVYDPALSVCRCLAYQVRKQKRPRSVRRVRQHQQQFGCCYCVKYQFYHTKPLFLVNVRRHHHIVIISAVLTHIINTGLMGFNRFICTYMVYIRIKWVIVILLFIVRHSFEPNFNNTRQTTAALWLKQKKHTP